MSFVCCCRWSGQVQHAAASGSMTASSLCMCVGVFSVAPACSAPSSASAAVVAAAQCLPALRLPPSVRACCWCLPRSHCEWVSLVLHICVLSFPCPTPRLLPAPAGMSRAKRKVAKKTTEDKDKWIINIEKTDMNEDVRTTTHRQQRRHGA